MPKKPRGPRKKKNKQDVVEVALQVLKAEGQPLQLQEIVERVAEALDKELDGKLSHYHTELNMDRRFEYVGKGLWGLRDWLPKELRVRSKAASGISEDDYEPSLEDYMWDEDAEDDSEDDDSEYLVPADEDMDDEDLAEVDDFDRQISDEDEDFDPELEEEFDFDDVEEDLEDDGLDEDEDPGEEEEDEIP